MFPTAPSPFSSIRFRQQRILRQIRTKFYCASNSNCTISFVAIACLLVCDKPKNCDRLDPLHSKMSSKDLQEIFTNHFNIKISTCPLKFFLVAFSRYIFPLFSGLSWFELLWNRFNHFKTCPKSIKLKGLTDSACKTDLCTLCNAGWARARYGFLRAGAGAAAVYCVSYRVASMCM